MTSFVTCECIHCNGKLEFESEHTGTRIKCPHCGKETVLSFLNESRQRDVAFYVKRSWRTIRDSSEKPIEDRLENTGLVFVFIGFLFALVMVCYGLSESNILVGISGIVIGLSGFVLRFVFSALAEIVRIQKKAANIVFSGHISGTKNEKYCENCEAEAKPYELICGRCKGVFRKSY